jgi:virulence factor Mce-like protein
MSRRSRTSVAANPVLIGAVTVMVVIVAVFLAYNANAGLPFIPTYEVSAVVPDASELVAGNDVNVGGTRVGLVTEVKAALQRNQPVAILTLKMDKSLQPLPRDTKLLIRQRSNVGLKYVELRLGHDRAGIAPGGFIPLRNASRAVDLDDVIGMFDRPTRSAFAGVISDLGVGLAGRGGDLNAAVEALPPLFRDLTIASRTLASRQADLDGFIRGVGSAVSPIAPVADPQRPRLDTGATTFGAIDRERAALGAAIDKSPAAEQAATAGFAALRPVLTQATALVRDANPGLRVLPRASRVLAGGLRKSGPALGRARALATPLETLIAATRTLSRMHATTGALQRLTDIVATTAPMLRYMNPFQTKCNALGLWFRNVPSIGSEGDAMGTWFRFTPVSNTTELLPHPDRSPELHYVPLPDVGQNGECEAGNELYVPGGQVVGPVPGRQPDATESTIPGTLAQNLDHEFATGGAR